jgi:glycosyltransferase involved in cell wall biosynthesis
VRLAVVVPGGVDRSGTERVIPALLSLIERLARRHHVHVAALRQEPEPGTWPLLGATVHNLGLPSEGLPGSGLLRFAPRLARLLAREGPFDVVHAFWAGTAAALAALATLRSGTPLAVHVAGGEVAALPDIDYGGWLHRRERMKTRFALSRATRVTAGSRFLAAKLSALGVPSDVVPLGADASVFSPEPEMERDGARLLHVASRNAVKDLPTLLAAFRRVVDVLPRARLDQVGEDVDGGASVRLAGELGLSSRVTFHGFLPPARLATLFRGASLFVQSSRWEAQGVAVLEAALAGTPTAGTAVGLVADLAPEAALAVPPQDPGALAEGILALLSDPERRFRMGRAARAFAVAHDADATAAAFESIYGELAGG